MLTTLSGLKTCSLPSFLFESLNPNFILLEKILLFPMGISRLSKKFLIVHTNSNTLAFFVMTNFTAASGLVESGSFVTKRNSATHRLTSPTHYGRFIPNTRTSHRSFLICVLDVFPFFFSRYSLCSSRRTN